MKIDQSSIEMTSLRNYSETGVKETRIVDVKDNDELKLQNWANRVLEETAAMGEQIIASHKEDPVTISTSAHELSKSSADLSTPETENTPTANKELEALKSLVNDIREQTIAVKGAKQTIIKEDNFVVHSEAEETAFSASGVINTQDGRRLEIAINQVMQRDILTAAGMLVQVKDPLVINFGDGPTELTEDKIAFDLDADGIMDSISFLKPGSGFLVLDKNQDGIVNDGRELLGPDTGSGFSELSGYDSDQNGWIDENDPIYGALSIWTKDSDGQDKMMRLKEADVGAVYLLNVDTQFHLKDEEQNLNGIVRTSGMYLTENGLARSVHEIDLTT